MNIENVKTSVTIMQRVLDKEKETNTNLVYMGGFQNSRQPFEEKKNNLEELHACGNTACFAGHLAISPELKAKGFMMGRSGEPCYNRSPLRFTTTSADDLNVWFEFKSPSLVGFFIYNNDVFTEWRKIKEEQVDSCFYMYGKKWQEIQSQDIITALTSLIELGEDAFVENLAKKIKKTKEDFKLNNPNEELTYSDTFQLFQTYGISSYENA